MRHSKSRFPGEEAALLRSYLLAQRDLRGRFRARRPPQHEDAIDQREQSEDRRKNEDARNSVGEDDLRAHRRSDARQQMRWRRARRGPKGRHQDAQAERSAHLLHRLQHPRGRASLPSRDAREDDDAQRQERAADADAEVSAARVSVSASPMVVALTPAILAACSRARPDTLARAQEAGAVRRDIEITDLLRLTHSIALMVEPGPEGATRAERLFEVMVVGLKG